MSTRPAPSLPRADLTVPRPEEPLARERVLGEDPIDPVDPEAPDDPDGPEGADADAGLGAASPQVVQ
jgi:hypothetical protein